MAFKGGTSLSKVYSLIKRFSEDVDVTIDYRELGCELPASELKELSSRKRSQLGDQLKAAAVQYVQETVHPYLQEQLKLIGGGEACEVVIRGEGGEELHVLYPSCVPNESGYMREYVKLEFGGRNLINPNAIHTIQPDIVEHFLDIMFPIAEGVVVLAPERTFWEKVTLIHAQCHKPIAPGKDRVSRHWYDLAMLAQHEIGKRAVADLGLLADVIDLKSTFYKSGTTNYEKCLEGELQLIPDAENLEKLREDYQAMQDAGMLNGHDFPLESIMSVLQELQDTVNQLALAEV